MTYKDFQDIQLSRLAMGNMRLPTKGEGMDAPIDEEKAQEIIDYGMANGINYYDTAYVYHGGESEKFLGRALKKYPRESYHLATKFFILANPDYKAVFEEQLSRLQTDYIDFYLIHGIFDHTYQQYIDSGCIAYFEEQKRLGRIKYLGFSSHAKPENLETFLQQRKWDFTQIQLNYFDWNYGTAKAEYELLEKYNVPIMVMEPCRGGRLASLSPQADALLKEAHPDWSVASWAFRWVKSLPQVQIVLSGMTRLEQIVDNVSTFSDPEGLSPEDTEILMHALDVFHGEIAVPCTACRYCCDGCPMEINIPEFLKVYNSYKIDGPRGLEDADHIVSSGRPADCIGCGACAEHCPQGIAIPGIMAELAEALSRPMHP